MYNKLLQVRYRQPCLGVLPISAEVCEVSDQLHQIPAVIVSQVLNVFIPH